MNQTLRDRENFPYATVTRRPLSTTEPDLDYIAIRNHDNLITISIEDVPAFMRAILDAANRSY